jgi:signal transduction histidine kinase
MRAARYSWGLCLFTCLCIAAHVGLYLSSDLSLFSEASVENGFPVILLGVVLGAAVGGLILSRDPTNRIGWLLSIGQAGTAAGLAADAYAYVVLSEHRLGPAAAGHLAAWLSHLFGAAYALPLMCALFLLVPDGRLPSWRWRPVMAVLLLSYLFYVAAQLVGVRPLDAGLTQEEAPTGSAASALLELSGSMLFIGVLAAAAALVVRLRRSTGVQRQQLRWIMASAALIAIGVVVLAGYQVAVEPGQPWYAILPLYLGYASVPVCTGIAVLRYRLYDIDLIINRAVVLAVLTTFVTIGYVAVVVLIGAAVGTGVDQRFWPSLVALVLVALAFQPLRQRVLRFADRLVYGRRAAPYEALADFSRRLTDSPEPSELLPRLAEAVARSVGAGHALVALDVPGTAGLSASWPDNAGRVPDVEFVVQDQQESLGRIAVTMPPGRGLRPAERRLLADFAAQAGLAFRNLRLDAELRARVEHLRRQSVDLLASRRRLLAARDDERQRIAELIERAVLSHLRAIPAASGSLDLADVPAADKALREMEEAAIAGLDALREITQGLFPAVLTRRGLAAALRAHMARIGRADDLTVAPSLDGLRFGEPIEAAAYFCGIAAVRDIDPLTRLALTMEAGHLVLEATGRLHQAGDWSAIVDRADAVDARLTTEQDPDGGFRLRIEFPLPRPTEWSFDHDGPASAHTAARRPVPNADLAM